MSRKELFDILKSIKKDVRNNEFYGTIFAVYTKKPMDNPKDSDVTIQGFSHESSIYILAYMAQKIQEEYKKAQGDDKN